jgi:uncharacterized membrane protein
VPVQREHDTVRRTSDRLAAPGLLLGLGLGGLVDGVVLHQVLQWHHLLSSEGCCPPTTLRGLELNTLADGLFHVATIALLIAGGSMLWARFHDGRAWSGRRLIGLILQGWGAFNVVEGLVDHHILGIHHVHPGPYRWAYDVAFLAFGAVLIVAGRLMARRPGDARRLEVDG